MAQGVDAGTIYSDVRIQLNKLDNDVQAVITRFNQMGEKIEKGSDQNTKKVSSNFDKMAVAGAAAFTAIGLGFKKLVSDGMAFEQSMANVRSVTNASASDFYALKEAAESAGASTRFSASDAADALYYLGSAGMNATQSVQALDGVLQFALATSTDLGQAADTVSATLSQFSLNADEAGRVANVFAAACAKSQANAEKLQSSMRQVGPVAGAMGISLEETTANLMALYNAGFQGEQAGTALRSILLELSDATSSTSQKLEKMGVNLSGINPRTVGLNKAIIALSKSGVDLGTVFGKETAAQMLVLAGTVEKSATALDDLQESITGTNAAAEAAAIQNDTLSGSIDELSSAGENVGDKLTEALTPALRGLADVAASVLNTIAEAPAFIKGLIGTIGGLGIAFGVVASAAKVLGLSLATALGPVGLVIAGISAGVVALGVGVSAAVKEADMATTKLVAHSDKLLDTYRGTDKAIEKVIGKITDKNKQDKLTQTQIDALTKAYPDLSSKIDLHTTSIEGAVRAQKELNIANAKALLPELERQLRKETEALRTKQGALQVAQTAARGASQMELTQANSVLEVYRRSPALLKSMTDEQRERYDWAVRVAKRGVISENAATIAAKESATAQEAVVQSIQDRINAINDEISGVAERKRAEAAAEQQKKEADASEAERRRRLAEDRLEMEKEINDYITDADTKEIDAIEQRRKAFVDYEQEQIRLAKLEESSAKTRAGKEAATLKASNAQTKIAEINKKADEEIAEIKRRTAVEDDKAAKKQQDALEKQAEIKEKIAGIVPTRQNDNFTSTEEIDKYIAKQRESASAELLRINAQDEYADQNVQMYAEAQEAIDMYYESLGKTEKIKLFQKNINTIYDYASEIFNSLAQMYLNMLQIETDTELDAIDERYEAQKDALDAQMQNELYAAGLTEAATIEQLESELKKAQETGDTKTISEAEDALKEQQIKEKYAAKETELEEKKKKEQARIQYKADLAAWEIQMAQATAAAAMATLNAYMSAAATPLTGWITAPIAAAIAGAAGLAQIGVVASTKPKLSYETGGIVPGTSFSGDNIQANVNSGEMVLTAAQQAALWKMANGGSSGSEATIIIQLDGRTIASSTVALVNNREYIIDARSVR